jgi:Tol biopolymer transport system component
MKIRWVPLTIITLSILVAMGCNQISSFLPGAAPRALGGGTGLIVFSAEINGNRDVYVVDVNGDNMTRLTDHKDWDWSPNWSLDGEKMVFLSMRDGNVEIYSMDANGTSIRRLTNNQSFEGYPVWSPDGKRIAYTSDRDEPDPIGCYNSASGCDTNIYVMNVDTLEETRIMGNPGLDEGPVWSPDGKRIAFFSNRNGAHDIYLMESDGTDVVRLTTNSADDWRPSWSRDGKMIAFASFRDGNSEIYTMNVDGTNVSRLTNNQIEDTAPAWSTDDKYVAFHSYVSEGYAEICYIEVANLMNKCITESQINAWEPSWQPYTKLGVASVINGDETTPEEPVVATPTVEQIIEPVVTEYIISAGIFSLDTQSSCTTDATINGVDDSGFQVGGTISMRDGAWALWCPGAKHTWTGTLSYEGYTFASDATDPLVFLVTSDGGYQYVAGTGKVTQPDGQVIEFP